MKVTAIEKMKYILKDSLDFIALSKTKELEYFNIRKEDKERINLGNPLIFCFNKKLRGINNENSNI
ncbi:hypothetical protein J4461_01705 [Candidatus Pacearchaeota archaeon]|nr:hypothetical protein [Candidatus Pacearchaeota archaeon]